MDNQENNPEQSQERNEQPLEPQRPIYTAFPSYAEPNLPRNLKHSGPGIASFVVFLVMVLVFIGSLITFFASLGDIFGSANVNAEEIQHEVENAPEVAVLGLAMIGSVLGYVIGLVLGIIGLVQKERKKVFAILGTVLNGLAVGMFLLLLLIGLAVGSAAA